MLNIQYNLTYDKFAHVMQLSLFFESSINYFTVRVRFANGYDKFLAKASIQKCRVANMTFT